MKQCINCQQQIEDNVNFCPYCRTPQNGEQPVNQQIPPQPVPPHMQQYLYTDPYDHTSEFDPIDVSNNKVYAMSVYILGFFGILIALFMQGRSKYVEFHLRQAIKLQVLNTLITIVSLVLCWTFIVPIAGGILAIILWIVNIICFFSVCNGKAKEAPVLRSFTFMK